MAEPKDKRGVMEGGRMASSGRRPVAHRIKHWGAHPQPACSGHHGARLMTEHPAACPGAMR